MLLTVELGLLLLMVCFLLCDETTLICEIGSWIRWLMLAGGCKLPFIPSVLVLLDSVNGLKASGLFLPQWKKQTFMRLGTICQWRFLDICSKTTQIYLTWNWVYLLFILTGWMRLKTAVDLIRFPLHSRDKRTLWQTPIHVFSKKWQKYYFWQNQVPNIQAATFPLSRLCYCVLECCLVWWDIVWSCRTMPYTAKHPRV